MSGPSTDDLIMATLVEIVKVLEETSSEDEGEASSRPPRQKRRYIDRPREEAGAQLMADYFIDGERCYFAEYFRRRFRMSRALFLRIVEGISNHPNQWFKQKTDCRGKFGFTTIQKCTSAIRQLAYGTAPDAFDEYLKISERTSRECLQYFCEFVIDIYGPKYLRKPTADDIQHLYEKHKELHGFPGMLGSIDCMHWEWENCLVAWQGQFHRGDHSHPTIMLEAVASYDLWIWHAFFGVAGANNDINVLNQSPLFNDIINDRAPDCPFEVNGVVYKRGYYLADGIYPEWCTFVKSFSNPIDEKRKRFKRAQEKARKDVERAFGVLQQRWGIIKAPARAWSLKKIRNVMYTCIILHNMIVEDEGHAITNFEDNEGPPPPPRDRRTFAQINEANLRNAMELRDRETHNNLRSDLVEHIARTPLAFLDN